MVSYSSHVLDRELIVFYLNGKKFGNRMAFCNRTFHLGRQLNGPDHSISDHLNNKQVKVCYSDKFTIQMFAIQIPTVLYT